MRKLYRMIRLCQDIKKPTLRGLSITNVKVRGNADYMPLVMLEVYQLVNSSTARLAGSTDTVTSARLGHP